MASEKFLITGAFGCIGAWAVKRLTDEGVPVVTYDLPGRPARLELIMEPDDLANVDIVAGDITDAAAFERVVVDKGITNIIHLAALQVPFVRANPILGAQVNVVGSAVVLETAKKHAAQVNGVTYASSIAIYGTADMYERGALPHDAPHFPVTLYGVTKEANEQWARIYWQDYQVPSIGLRPFFVYGPGRDQGVSSTPTKAMVAAAAGRPYHVSFGGTALYQHADDVAASFIQASRAMPKGCEVYNLGGTDATVEEIVGHINRIAPEMAGKITHETAPLFTPDSVDGSELEKVIGPVRWRSIEQGIRDTMDHVRSAVSAGRIDLDRAIN
jgi:UDP-glucuronate 4-epimerase